MLYKKTKDERNNMLFFKTHTCVMSNKQAD